MEFEVLVSKNGLVKQYKPVIFTIKEDEFFYRKKKKESKVKRFHISYLNEVYIQQQIKEKPEYVLILEIGMRNLSRKKKDKKLNLIKVANKEEKNTTILSDIKQLLNVKRLQYDLNLFLFNWKLKTNILINKENLSKLKDGKQSNDIKNSLSEKIEKSNNKEKINELLQGKLNNFIQFLNQQDIDVNLLSFIR